mgnify:CR=1 FL=1
MAKKKKLVGAIKPRLMNTPLKGDSKIQDVIDLAEKIGMPLLPWQEHVLKDMLTVNKDGMWVRKTNLLRLPAGTDADTLFGAMLMSMARQRSSQLISSGLTASCTTWG